MKYQPIAVLASAVLVMAGLAGCTSSAPGPVEGSAVTVAVADRVTSLNPMTRYGATTANRVIAASAQSGFAFADQDGGLTLDPSFGQAEIVSEEPFRVTYTVADGVRWSDGAAVDAADLVLGWVSNSRALDTADADLSAIVDPANGLFLDALPAGVVVFDSASTASPSMAETVGLPVVSADRRSVTLEFSEAVTDWRAPFAAAGTPLLPAHVIAAEVFGEDDIETAKADLVEAVLDDDREALGDIADLWNRGFTVDDPAALPNAAVSSGPYTVAEALAAQFATLQANPEYQGSRTPVFAEFTVRTVGDPLAAVQALSVGAVQVAALRATAPVLDALTRVPVTSHPVGGTSAVRLDLRVQNAATGIFADPLVREAFLASVEPATLAALAFPGAPVIPVPAGMPIPQADNQPSESPVDPAAVLAGAGLVDPVVCLAVGDGLGETFDAIARSAATSGFVVEDCTGAETDDGAITRVIDGAWESPRDVAARYGSEGARNLSGWADPATDAALRLLLTATDATARSTAVNDLDAALDDAHLARVLYRVPSLVAHTPTVEGVPDEGPQQWTGWTWKPVFTPTTG